MKVFLSWSGDLSRQVAVALRDWLPSVLQCVVPYVSSEDIDKGARWSTDIAAELAVSSFGILCVTKDNVDAPWLNFEAGALSKAIDKSRVCPFLLNLKRTDVRGPLLQFQSTICDPADVRKLIGSINVAAGEDGLDDQRLERTFEVWWPRLAADLERIAANVGDAGSSEKRPAVLSEESERIEGMVEEILELVRGQQKIVSDPRNLLPPAYVEAVLGEIRQLHASHPVWRELERIERDVGNLLADPSMGEKTSDVLLPILRRMTHVARMLKQQGGWRRYRGQYRVPISPPSAVEAREGE